MPLFRTSWSSPVKGGPRKGNVKRFRRREKGCGSLTGLCLWSLAENMKDVWAKDYTQKYMDQFCFRYVMGPFNMLPGHLIEELLSLLTSRHLLTRGALHLLLLPQLRRLSLASYYGLATPGLCHLIGVRCPSLLCLDLSGAQQLCSAVLCELVGALPSLRSLSLAGTLCDRQVVRVVAAGCPSLQHLDLSQCHCLAPMGLLPLAYRPGGGYTGLGLRSLLARDIGFGEEEEDRAWVAAFLLLSLPLLVRAALEDLGRACRIIARREFTLSADFTVRAGVPSLGEVWGRRVRGEIGGEMEEISNGGEEEEWATSESEDEEVMEDGGGAVGGNEGRKVSVSGGLSGEGEVSYEKQLTLSLQDAQGVSCGALMELGLVCPDLHSLALIGEEQEGPLAAPAMAQWAGQMHNLSLQLAGDLHEVLSVIQAVGESLTSLTLEGIRIEGNASFLQLLHSCPKLRTLHIHAESPSRAEEEEEDEEEEDIAANLRDVPSVPLLQSLKLNFFLEQAQTKPAMSWRALKWPLAVLLAGSPLLEKVSLTAIPCPLDDVFHLVNSRPLLPSEPIPLQRLHDLSMTRCDISDGTVMRLVSSANCLSSLDLSGCWPVTFKCIGLLQKKAIRRQCPLTVVWV